MIPKIRITTYHQVFKTISSTRKNSIVMMLFLRCDD